MVAGREIEANTSVFAAKLDANGTLLWTWEVIYPFGVCEYHYYCELQDGATDEL